MGRPANWVATIFNFYLAQSGAGLSLVFLYVLVHSGALSSLIVAIILGAFVVLIIAGLGLMTCLNLDPDQAQQVLACAPAFALFYLTVHLLLGRPPDVMMFAAMVFAALAHLLMVGLFWHRAHDGLQAA